MAQIKLVRIHPLGDNVIPVRLRMDNIAILVGVIVLLGTFVLYFIDVVQGRWLTAMPLLTEPGSAPPTGIIFSAVYSIAAVLSALLLFFFVTWGELYGHFRSKFVTFSQISAVICPLFLLIVANFRPDDSLSSGYFGLIPFFVLTFFFCTAVCVRLFKSMRPTLRIARCVIVAVSAACIVLPTVPLPISWPASCTKTSICAVVLLALIFTFLMTMKIEISQLRFDLVVFSDDF
jgi:hypothetical protein